MEVSTLSLVFEYNISCLILHHCVRAKDDKKSQKIGFCSFKKALYVYSSVISTEKKLFKYLNN